MADTYDLQSGDVPFGASSGEALTVMEFPFRCRLSLAPLVAFWNQTAASGHPAKAALAKQIQDEVRQAAELLEPIEDLSLLEQHQGLVDLLMSAVFPPASWDRDYSAATIPFHFRSFYATPSFGRWLAVADGTFEGLNLDREVFFSGKLLRAYLYILKQFYGIALDFEYPLICTRQDPETDLARHFQLNIDGRFLAVRSLGELPPLTDEAQQYLRAHLTDLQVWMEILPPEHFEFHGFSVIHAVDVTDQEVLSALKRDLIQKESLISNPRFQSLQERLRTLLRRPQLVLSLAAIQGEQVFLLNSGCKLERHCIFADSDHYRTSDFAGSIYERSVREGKLLIIEDLTSDPAPSPIEEAIIQRGVRNIVVAPLYYQDELIGTLDLGSPNPGDLNAINAMKLGEVLPLFSMAIKRSMEELNTTVQAIIKEKYTAIHPSVEWRFRKAALSVIQQQNAGILSEIEPIVFEGVYPLYGASDIRGSSTLRHAAIQADLVDHLNLAREIFLLAYRQKPLPFFDEFAYRIGKTIAELEAGLGSGDEATTLDFLRREVEPLLDHMQEFGAAVHEKIQVYRAALDPHLGILYRRRRDFEESVTRINKTISAYLDAEQGKAQAMFPHYFEKHVTDGVDYGIYIGPSLVEDGKFEGLYLKNLRLWQLMVMCGVARQIERLKASLKVPLEAAHLILVQNTPLSIRFRLDEKQFDVDGAYNIRYEIIKKRIDKAVIKGSAERLTQPGKIAIIYSQAKEALEYQQYIDYLQAAAYLTGEVEEVELEDLQGLQGLKALRVTVNMQPPVIQEHAAPAEMEEAIQATSGMVT
jgi:GAF domain-containing protein